MQFKYKILVWFMIASTVLMCDAIFVYRSLVNLTESKRALIETHQTIDRLEDIVSSIKDVHASQRGYIITGMHDYLAPYTLAIPKIEKDFVVLEQIFAQNSDQLKNLTLVKTEAEKRITLAAQIIDTFENQGAEAAFEMVRSGRGKKEMDEIRALIGDMVNRERMNLQLRRAVADDALDMTFYVAGGGLIICFFIMGFVFYQIIRENGMRSDTEDTLKKALTEMEMLSQENKHISHMAEYLQSCQAPEEAYKILKELMPTLFKATYGRIATFNNSRNLIESMLVWGDDSGAEKSADEFMSQECWALRRGQAHHYHLGGNEPLCAHVTSPAASSLCLPMQAHGETIGLLYIASDSPQALLDKKEQRLAKRISEQASLAISNLKLQHKLMIQSTHDPLTRLFNRRYLEATLEREISRAKRSGQSLCVMVLDIDHFKKFNDTRGHDAGDALLVGFAKLLQEKTRKEDIVCRYGGEEFVIVLPGAPAEMGLQHAEKLCAATRDLQVMFNGQDLGTITVSIGVASYPQNGETQDALISRADAALYEAKHGGRNQALLAK